MYYAAGFGGNFIVVIPQHDLVVVTRWLEPKTMPEFIQQLMTAVKRYPSLIIKP